MVRRRIESFEDLIVWQRGIEFVKQGYVLTREGEMARDFGFRDQLRRASVSIPTNIAEGFERASRKEYMQFLNVAKGSAGEVRSLLPVALDIGYLDQARYDELREAALELRRYLHNQIKSLQQVDR